MVVALRNVIRDKEFFWGIGMKGVKGSLYLGDFIGDRDVETTWLDEKVQGWAESVRALSRVARNHPNSAYAGLQKLIQQE